MQLHQIQEIRQPYPKFTTNKLLESDTTSNDFENALILVSLSPLNPVKAIDKQIA